MRIAWWSHAPWMTSSFGQQTAQVTKRLVADGHDVAVLTTQGLKGAPQRVDGVTAYPHAEPPVSAELAAFQAGHHEAELFIGLLNPIGLVDVEPAHLDPFRVATWTPIEFEDVPKLVLPWSMAYPVIAMSRDGQRKFADAGIEAAYIPHAIESTFRPTESDVRERMGIPDDAFLVMINASFEEIGMDRKNWAAHLEAFAVFAERHPDAYLFLQAGLRLKVLKSVTLDLEELAVRLGVPEERVRVIEQGPYHTGLVTQDLLAKLYAAADVLLFASREEGFGIPTIEAQACGTPVIVTDAGPQPELVGAGWTVAYDHDWNYPTEASLVG